MRATTIAYILLVLFLLHAIGTYAARAVEATAGIGA